MSVPYVTVRHNDPKESGDPGRQMLKQKQKKDVELRALKALAAHLGDLRLVDWSRERPDCEAELENAKARIGVEVTELHAGTHTETRGSIRRARKNWERKVLDLVEEKWAARGHAATTTVSCQFTWHTGEKRPGRSFDDEARSGEWTQTADKITEFADRALKRARRTADPIAIADEDGAALKLGNCVLTGLMSRRHPDGRWRAGCCEYDADDVCAAIQYALKNKARHIDAYRNSGFREIWLLLVQYTECPSGFMSGDWRNSQPEAEQSPFDAVFLLETFECAIRHLKDSPAREMEQSKTTNGASRHSHRPPSL